MKKCMILICLIFITGCSARYTIEFNDKSIKDKLSVYGIDLHSYNDIKEGVYSPIPAFKDAIINLEEPIKNEGVEYYNISGDDSNAYLDYKFELSDFEDSYFANTCYDYFKVFQEKDEIIISTGKNFKCFFPGRNLDSVDIVIKSNHKIIYNNADEVKNNEYIWHINKSNKDDANIQISFSKDYNEKKKSINIAQVSLYIGIFGVVALVIALFVLIKNKRVNKI